MKIFGSISELVDLAFRLAGGKQVKLRAATQTTSGNLVTVNVPDVAATGDTQSMVLNAATQTLSNKTLSSPTISGGTINNSIIGGSTPAAGTFTDIVGSTLDINTSAELQTLTIPSFSTAGVLHNNSSGAVSSSLIVDADITNSTITLVKLASIGDGKIVIGANTTGDPTARTMSGDVTIDNLGVTSIGASKVTDSMLAGNITRTKLATGNAYRIVSNDSAGAITQNESLAVEKALVSTPTADLASKGPVTTSSTTAAQIALLDDLDALKGKVQAQIDGKQAADATLSTIAALAPTTDQYIYFSGADTATTGTITSFGRGLIDDADAATARSTLGLGSMATQAASSVAITGGTVRGVSLDRLAVESDNAAIASGTLVPSKGLMIITAGDNTLNTLNPGVGFNLVNGAVLTVINNEGADVTVTNAGNIQTGTGSDFTLKQGAASSFIWSTTLSKWVLSGGAGGAGGLATTYVTAGGITAVNNTHYLTNLSASGQTITLPSGTDGAVIRFSDAGEVWNVYPLTIAPATGQRINNLATNETLVCDVKGGWVELSFNSTYGGWALMSLASTTGTSGSGSGEINAISNPSAASDTTGWTNASRVTSGSPLDPVVSTALSIANAAGAESSTSGGRFNIASLPSGLRSRKLKVSFYFSTPATDVYKVSVYAGSTRLALSSDAASPTLTVLPANVTGGYFEAYFDSTTASAYSLNITRTLGSTGACVITQVIVGPGINAQGAAISEWQSYTPTWASDGTQPALGNGTLTGQYRRVGSSIEVEIDLTMGSSTTYGTSFYRFSLPSIVTPSGVNGQLMGVGQVYQNSSTGNTISPFLNTAAANDIYLVSSSGGLITSTVPFTFASGNRIKLQMKYQVTQWAGNGTVNLGAGAQVEYAATSGTWDADSSTTVYGPAGQALGGTLAAARTKTVTWQYPIQADDQIVVEFSRDGTTWAPANGFRFSTVFVIQGLDSTGGEVSGVYCHNTSSTQTVVTFGRYANIANDDAPAANWPSSNAFWRVRKAKASAPVGFGKANSNEFGLVAPRRGQQALTVTSSVAGWTTTRAVGVYYQDQDGNHRLKFNLYGTNSSGSRTGCTLTISGVTFKNVSNFYQPCAFMTDSAATPTQAYTNPNASTLGIVHSSATTTYYGVSGDVELDSKPTWA